MVEPHEEAELERTKMSFGQHLEELRWAVIKSLLALAAGIAIGLCIGQYVVDYVQTPLRAALERYYTRQAVASQLVRLQELKAAGQLDLSQDNDAKLAELADQMAREALSPRDCWVSPPELAAALEDRYPDAAKELTGRAGDGDSHFSLRREDMIRLRLYEPLEDDSRTKLKALSGMEPFGAYMKASLLAGAVIASPLVFYFLWEFVAAGLYRHEKRYIHLYLPISLALFWAGVAIAFYFAFGFLLDFFFWFFEAMGIEPDLRLSDWLSFVLLMPLGFGISFQLPLVMVALERIGLVTVEAYLSYWRAAIVAIAVIAMVLTPSTDPYSMLIMGTPLVGLYFGGILMCKYMPRGTKRPAKPAPPKVVPPKPPRPEEGAGS